MYQIVLQEKWVTLLAEALRNRGAHVTLVTGPTQLADPIGVDVIHIESAEEMFEAVTTRFDKQDIVIKAACFQIIRQVLDHKMKKQDGDLAVTFKRTKDILKYLGYISNWTNTTS